MGYTTSFHGAFYVDGPLSAAAIELINGLGTTRRVKRDSQKLADRLGITLEECKAKYGNEGQLFCGDKRGLGFFSGCDVVDDNSPPVGQPGLWCQWIYDERYHRIVWDGGEKFYDYVEWIEYLIRIVISPEGRGLNGIVRYFGQNKLDMGFIEIENNLVTQYVAASFQPM